jgi:hypothetical protein
MYCSMPDKDDIECKEGTADDGRGSISGPPTVAVTVSPPSVTVSPGSCPPDDNNGSYPVGSISFVEGGMLEMVRAPFSFAALIIFSTSDN